MVRERDLARIRVALEERETVHPAECERIGVAQRIPAVPFNLAGIGAQPLAVQSLDGSFHQRRKILTASRQGQCFGKQGGCPSASRRTGIPARALPQGPQRPPMAVFRAFRLLPLAIEAQAISESLCRLIEGKP